MNHTPTELQKLLQHLDQLIAQASDESARAELQRLRARLNTPEMRDLERELAGSRPADPAKLVLEFHDPLLPTVLTAAGAVTAAAVCVFAVLNGAESTIASIAGNEVNLWVLAVFSGACSVMFTALSFMRTFSVRFDIAGMTSRISGGRWKRLHVGEMLWKDIRSLQERLEDRLLEVRAAGGEQFEIPMKLANYAVLKQHLENMVRLYGDRPVA
jgi:hypothetical protein